MKYTLYLASGSSGRKKLLENAQISFQLISHTADESTCSLDQPIEVVVKQLALLKMQHVSLPAATDGQVMLVLTADTLTLDSNGELLGKPVDRQQAIIMLQNRNPALVGTAFCLEKKEYRNGAWHTLQQIVDYDFGWCTMDIPDYAIDLYLSKIPYLSLSGATSVGGFGEQFVKEIRGSYSAIVGMPMYKLREALYAIGFY